MQETRWQSSCSTVASSLVHRGRGLHRSVDVSSNAHGVFPCIAAHAFTYTHEITRTVPYPEALSGECPFMLAIVPRQQPTASCSAGACTSCMVVVCQQHRHTSQASGCISYRRARYYHLQARGKVPPGLPRASHRHIPRAGSVQTQHCFSLCLSSRVPPLYTSHICCA
jgi:hypothetical protein